MARRCVDMRISGCQKSFYILVTSTIAHHHYGNSSIQLIVGTLWFRHTSHDDDDGSVKFYFPSYMARWHPECPRRP
eukprot:12933887-Prorocentrum_lima.AAC.1